MLPFSFHVKQNNLVNAKTISCSHAVKYANVARGIVLGVRYAFSCFHDNRFGHPRCCQFLTLPTIMYGHACFAAVGSLTYFGGR